MNHTLAQNNLCEFWCGMQRTCKNTNNKLTRRMKLIIYNYIKTYNHSRHWPYKTTAIKYMSPPAASYMRPGAGLYMYIYIKQVRLHRNIAASSLAADCNVPQRPPATKQVEVLHLFRWFTHTLSIHLNTHTNTTLTHTHTHTRLEWIIVVIRQELNPVTCN